MSYRLIYIGLGLLVVAAVAFGVALSDSGEPVTLPDPVEAVYPLPGDLVPFQTTLQVDMEVGYSAAIYVDGWLVQDVNFIEGTGVYTWEPSSSNPTINEWAPGEHTIRVEYNTVSGLPDVGEFEWTFRVG
jgi:hypothetical protein